MTMSFRVKNTGVTYQRAIHCCLKDQIGKNVEAYVDDVVVKSKTTDNLITDDEETFQNLKKFQCKLNPTKCIFSVPSSILLCNVVSHHGIEANLEKIEAVTKMKSSTCVKDVQKLTGCMVALSHFIS